MKLSLVLRHVLLASSFAAALCFAQGDRPESSRTRLSSPRAGSQQEPARHDSLVSREIDMLHRDGYRTARQATAIVQPVTQGGRASALLEPHSLKLFVNGTEREFESKAPGDWSSPVEPMVLLVFPPNQPIIHALAIKQTRSYLVSLAKDDLPWKFAILDSNGRVTPYTRSRAELLDALDRSDHARQPLIAGGWLGQAEVAVAAMLPVQGPKILWNSAGIPVGMHSLHVGIVGPGGEGNFGTYTQLYDPVIFWGCRAEKLTYRRADDARAESLFRCEGWLR